MEDLIGKLRIACKPAHHQVEQTFLLKQLVAGNIGSEDYVRLLHAMYEVSTDFFDYFHESLNDSPFANFISNACRLSELRHDLLRLGVSDQYRAKPLVNFESKPEVAIGAMYVLLGAANGAQFLSQAIDKNPNTAVRAARYFFTNNSADRLLIWKDFVTLLSNTAFKGAHQATIIDTATKTFGLMTRKLDNAILATQGEVEHG